MITAAAGMPSPATSSLRAVDVIAEFLHSGGLPLAADDAAVAIVGALADAGLVAREIDRGGWQDPSAQEGVERPADHIYWYDDPKGNARWYVHVGCDGDPSSQWMVPLDDCPAPSSPDHECGHCAAVRPLFAGEHQLPTLLGKRLAEIAAALDCAEENALKILAAGFVTDEHHVWSQGKARDRLYEIERHAAATASAPQASPGEHPHLGRIQAVAHLSDMYAKSYCSEEALVEDGVSVAFFAGRVSVAFFAGQHPEDVRQMLADQADLILEPFGVANVLQTVEEVLGGDERVLTEAGMGRVAIVTDVVDAALAAREDERGTDGCECGDLGCGEAPGLWIEVDPADRMRACDALCGIGRVFREPGENPETGHARILVEGHDFDEELVRSTLHLADGGPVAIYSIGPPAPRPTEDEREAEHA